MSASAPASGTTAPPAPDGQRPEGGADGQRPPTPADPAQQNPEPFDRDRAMALIDRLREESRTAREQARTVQQELEELRAQVRQYEDRDATELERLQRQVSDLTSERDTAVQRASDLEQRYREHRIETAVRLAATEESTRFANPADALVFLNRAALVIADDGSVDAASVATELTRILTERPYLAGQRPADPPAPPPVPPTEPNGAGRTAEEDREARQSHARLWRRN